MNALNVAFFSIAPSALLVAVSWLCRQLIVTRLKASVQYEFDEKVAKLRADLTDRNAILKSDLDSKGAVIDALRHGALSSLSSAHQELNKRKLAAVDQIWAAATIVSKSKAAVSWMQVIKFESAAKEVRANEDARRLFEAMAIKPDALAGFAEEAAKARPYVTSMAWAYYSAYSSVGMFAVMQLQMLATGSADPKYLNDEALTKMLVVALPHHKENLYKLGSQFANHLMDELEQALLDELKRSLMDHSGEIQRVQQASEIVEEAEKVRMSLQTGNAKTVATAG